MDEQVKVQVIEEAAELLRQVFLTNEGYILPSEQHPQWKDLSETRRRRWKDYAAVVIEHFVQKERRWASSQT